MKRSTKYVGLDVHQASTVSSVREEGGHVIARTIVPTERSAIVELFHGMRGSVHVAFEEGTQAQWLHDLIAPLVAHVIVCDRRDGRRRDRPPAGRRSPVCSGTTQPASQLMRWKQSIASEVQIRSDIIKRRH